MSNLLRLIKHKNYSVKNVKEEAVLVLVHHLLGQYLNAINQKIDKPLINNPSKEDEDYILEVSNDIYLYLNEKIISADLMDSILEVSLKEKKYIAQSALLEPIAFFYDILTTSYNNNKDLLKVDKDGNYFWIPELLAFSIVVDLKEKGFTFNKFNYISEFDFTKLLNIYNKISIQIAKNDEVNTSILQSNKNTPIKAIQDISLLLTEKLIESRYINMTKKNKSKKRRKNGKRK